MSFNLFISYSLSDVLISHTTLSNVSLLSSVNLTGASPTVVIEGNADLCPGDVPALPQWDVTQVANGRYAYCSGTSCE